MVVFETTHGTMKIEVSSEVAPVTVSCPHAPVVAMTIRKTGRQARTVFAAEVASGPRRRATSFSYHTHCVKHRSDELVHCLLL